MLRHQYLMMLLTCLGLLMTLAMITYTYLADDWLQADIQHKKSREIPEHILLSLSPFIIQSEDGRRVISRLDAIKTNSSQRRAQSQPHLLMFTPSSQTKGPVALTTRAQNLKTFAVIQPCQDSSSVCHTNSSYTTKQCLYNTCVQTQRLEEADVVVLYLSRTRTSGTMANFVRSPHQRWVMSTSEPPSATALFHILNQPFFRGHLNWTQSYRLDSDLPQLFGQLQKVRLAVKNYPAIYRRKHMTAACFVNQCISQSQQLQYIRRMQAVTDIHIFGACGNYTCGFGGKGSLEERDCLQQFSHTYFFYLSFEVALCRDYVTETFFKIFDTVDILPVVRGAVEYKQYFPRKAFIDAADFVSPESLAKFLVSLARDKKRYLFMLKEKNKYQNRAPEMWYCQLCRKMQTPQSNKKWYPDLKSWYLQQACYQPHELELVS